MPYIVEQMPGGQVQVKPLSGSPDVSALIQSDLAYQAAQTQAAQASGTANLAQAQLYGTQNIQAQNQLAGGAIGFEMMRNFLADMLNRGALGPPETAMPIAIQILSRTGDALISGISAEKKAELDQQRQDKMLGGFQNTLSQFQGIAKSGVPQAAEGFLGALALQSKMLGGPSYGTPEEFAANIGNAFQPVNKPSPLTIDASIFGAGSPAGLGQSPFQSLAPPSLNSTFPQQAASASGGAKVPPEIIDELSDAIDSGDPAKVIEVTKKAEQIMGQPSGFLGPIAPAASGGYAHISGGGMPPPTGTAVPSLSVGTVGSAQDIVSKYRGLQ